MPDIKKFFFKVEAGLDVTRAEVDHMIRCSQAHYDYKCKAAGKHGGFLYGWRNHFEADEQGPVEVWATWNQIDLLCKILEVEQWLYSLPDVPKDEPRLYWPVRQIITRMSEESERVNE